MSIDLGELRKSTLGTCLSKLSSTTLAQSPSVTQHPNLDGVVDSFGDVVQLSAQQQVRYTIGTFGEIKQKTSETNGNLNLENSPSAEDGLDSHMKQRCNRIIYRNKYERNAAETRNWWNQLFRMLEDDSIIPPEEQRAVLEGVLDRTALHKVLKICATRDRQFKEELKAISEDDIAKMIRTMKMEKEFTSEVPTNKRIVSSDKTVVDHDHQPALREPRETHEKLYDKGEENQKSKMYMDFFKRKPNRAAVWRTLPPLSMSEMNLNQKAEAITEQIATDFINWLRDLGGDEELSLSVQAVIEMFEIGFHANSATSLKVNVKEMPSVPRRVAEAKNMRKKSRRIVLHREIMKDIKASKKKTTYTAFGTQLPYNMQVRPPAENYYRKWMSCDRVPEKLASMAAVWQGITHLKSTRAYCEFLIERPDIKPPKYLLDCGMMDPKTLRERDGPRKSDDISPDFPQGSM